MRGVESTNAFTVTSMIIPSWSATASLVCVSCETFLVAAQWREWQARAAA